MGRDTAAKSAASHEMVFIAVFGTPGSEPPVDMLRYDSCVPADEGQAMKLQRQGVEGWIIFKRFVAVGATLKPSVDRWHSFGFECLSTVFKSFADAEKAATEHHARKVKDAAARLSGGA